MPFTCERWSKFRTLETSIHKGEIFNNLNSESSEIYRQSVDKFWAKTTRSNASCIDFIIAANEVLNERENDDI